MTLAEFLKTYNVQDDCENKNFIAWAGVYALACAYEQSQFLRRGKSFRSLKWISRHYKELIRGKYKDYAKTSIDEFNKTFDKLNEDL